MSKSVAIGADHAGFEYKEFIKGILSDVNLTDFGTNSADSADYPDFAHPVASFVESGQAEFGILVCGSANGVAITANKHAGIRAAICWNTELASLARRHNNANVLCIPARFISQEETEKIVHEFLNTAFEGGRHAIRVGKIAC